MLRCFLASVDQMLTAGNRVVFDSEGHYIENKLTKQRTEMYRRDGNFYFKMWVAKPKVSSVVSGVESGTGAASGFTWPAVSMETELEVAQH